MPLRKGQKLCNWIHIQGFDNENVHKKLFYMSDKEFDEVMNMTDDELLSKAVKLDSL